MFKTSQLFTSRDVVSCISDSCTNLYVVREAEDCEEISKEEVAGASQVLDLLADINRRGMLFRVILSKVFFFTS